jgi:hypothetical protein
MLHDAFDQDALTKTEFFNHRAGHKWIGSLSLVVVLGVSKEAVTVWMQFKHTATRFIRQRFPVFLSILGISTGTIASTNTIAPASTATRSIIA